MGGPCDKLTAPSPSCRAVCEGAAKQGRNDICESKDGAEKTLEKRTPMKGDGVHRDRDRAREDACAAHTGESTSDDQRNGARCRTADSRTDLKHQNATEEYNLDAVDNVELAEEELEGAVGQKVCGAVPADICHRMELVGDLRDSGRDDESVLRS